MATFSSPYIQLFCSREPLNYYLYYLGVPYYIYNMLYPNLGVHYYIYNIIYPKTLFELLRPPVLRNPQGAKPTWLAPQVLPPVEPMLAQMMLNAKCWCAPLRTARSDRFLFGSTWLVPFRSRS